MTIKDILKDWLKKKGFDGLSGTDCGCGLDNLCPCEEYILECEPARYRECKSCEHGKTECSYRENYDAEGCYYPVKEDVTVLESPSLDRIVICTFDEKYIPERKHRSVGWDCKAHVSAITEGRATVLMHPGKRLFVPLGFKVAMPEDCHMDIRPRSGLAILHGVTVLNSPGLVDPDYRGEVSTILINLDSQEIFTIEDGDRISQAVFSKDYPVELVVDPDLFENFDQAYPTERG
jgi:deoxyuridine 5'-triphosphate nucleotidohydrolase